MQLNEMQAIKEQQALKVTHLEKMVSHVQKLVKRENPESSVCKVDEQKKLDSQQDNLLRVELDDRTQTENDLTSTIDKTQSFPRFDSPYIHETIADTVDNADTVGYTDYQTFVEEAPSLGAYQPARTSMHSSLN